MDNRTKFIRVEKNDNYSVIHNQFLRRKDLSWKAKGILTYILMLPDDWNINLNEIMTHATEGEAAFRSGWKELKEAGYVNRYPIKDENTKRILYWETVVSETAQNPHGDFPDVGNPDVEKPDVGNRNLQSTDRTKYLTKQSTNNKEQSSDDDFEKLWKLYPNKKGKKKAKAAYKRAIKNGATNKEIQDGIVNYKKHLARNKDWLKPAHGSVWFNQERWTDEYEESLEPQINSNISVLMQKARGGYS